MTGTSAHEGNVGKCSGTDGAAAGVQRWHAVTVDVFAGDALGGDALARDALALDALDPHAPTPGTPARGIQAPGTPTQGISAAAPGHAVLAGAVPTESTGARHPRRTGVRRRWRALRLGLGWAVLVAIGGATMLPAADALASGVDRPPYIVQQVVAASPTATSQGEGTRRD